MPELKAGDRVRVVKNWVDDGPPDEIEGATGTLVAVRATSSYRYLVRLDSKVLIPPEVWVSEVEPLMEEYVKKSDLLAALQEYLLKEYGITFEPKKRIRVRFDLDSKDWDNVIRNDEILSDQETLFAFLGVKAENVDIQEL